MTTTTYIILITYFVSVLGTLRFLKNADIKRMADDIFPFNPEIKERLFAFFKLVHLLPIVNSVLTILLIRASLRIWGTKK